MTTSTSRRQLACERKQRKDLSGDANTAEAARQSALLALAT